MYQIAPCGQCNSYVVTAEDQIVVLWMSSACVCVRRTRGQCLCIGSVADKLIMERGVCVCALESRK